MKFLKAKTQAEIDGTAHHTEMTQQEYNAKYYSGSQDIFWHCDRCSVLFEHDDVVIERVHGKEHELRCPRMKKLFSKNWLGIMKCLESRCLTRLTCADMGYWKKNYHLSDPAPSPSTNAL